MKKNYINVRVALLYCIQAFSVCFILAGYVVQAGAQHVNLEWAISMGGNLQDEGYGVAVDGTGNVYVTGYFRASADFNPGGSGGTLTAAASLDAFLAKYDANGNYLWVKRMGGDGLDRGWGVAVDGTGNVYVTGSFQGSADFNPGGSGGTLAAAGGTDVFIAKYDANGNYLWAKGISGSDTEHGFGIAVDSTGNVYVTGTFEGSVDFNPGTGTAMLTAAGSWDAFIAGYDPNGNYLWAKRIGGGGLDQGYGVAVDGTGNVYVTGFFGGVADFDPGITLIAPFIDAFLARYDANGNCLWAKNTGSSGSAYGHAVAADSAGNVCVTGYFYLSADFDPGNSSAVITAAGDQDVFIARYDPNGNFLWAKSIGGSGLDQGQGVAVDGTGYVYVTGLYTGSADFNSGSGTDTLTAAGLLDAFLTKYDANGNFLWAKSMGGSGRDLGYGVAVHGKGNVYVMGMFEHTADFDPGPDTAMLTPAGDYDVFVVKLACSDTTSSYLRVTECGDSYTLNGEVYTATGMYTQSYTGRSGCDSAVILDLTLSPIDYPVITVHAFVLGVTGTYVTHQWIKDSADIPGATDPVYTVTENGHYQVRVTDINGCETTSAVYGVNNVGIDEDKGIGKHVSIYPNPVHEVIHISSPVNVDVHLSSIEGRNILYVENAGAIPVHDLASGMYLLRITDKEGRLIKVEKVMKEQQ